MITIKTATGKEFISDYLTESEHPERLYFNVVSAPLATVAMTFTDPSELPIEGHEEYNSFSSLSDTRAGVSVCLKKGSA